MTISPLSMSFGQAGCGSARRFRLALACGALLAPALAQAGVWQQSASLPLGLEYDSNPELRETDEESVWLVSLTPGYSLAWTDGRNRVYADAKLRLERSSDVDLSTDREDPDLLLGWRTQAPRGEYGVAAGYQETSTRTSTMEEAGPAGLDGTRRESKVLADGGYAYSERIRLGLSASAKAVDYDVGQLVDYTQFALVPGVTRVMDEQTDAFLRLSATSYQPDGSRSASSELYGMLLGFDRRVSDRLDWSVAAGVTATAGDSEDTGWQGTTSVAYRLERATLRLEGGRSVLTNSTGGFSEADQAKASLSYALSEKTSALVDADWRDTRDDNPQTETQFGAGLTHRLSPAWQFRLSYRARHRQASGEGSAISNIVAATLSYSFSDH